MQKKNYKIYQNKLTILILIPIPIQIIKNYQNHQYYQDKKNNKKSNKLIKHH